VCQSADHPSACIHYYLIILLSDSSWLCYKNVQKFTSPKEVWHGCWLVYLTLSVRWWKARLIIQRPVSPLLVEYNDFLFLAGLVAYWPAPIHAAAPPAYTVLTWLPARLAVCYSQRRSIFSSATAFTTATLRWQQSRYRSINGKKWKPAILWA